MRKTRKLASAVLAATMVAGMTMGVTDAYARSSNRAAWNNAAGQKEDYQTVSDALFTEDGKETAEHSVESNVYADSAKWTEWQTKWSSIRTNFEQVALTPGKDATQLNFAWYSLTEEKPQVKLLDASGNEIKTFEGTQDVANKQDVTVDDVTYTLYPGKVTVTGLKENTSYKYQYFVDGKWSEAFDYNTQSASSFSVMYVGDPQIGASVGQDDASKEEHAKNDAYNWNETLANAASAHKDLSFILSAGDQINQTSVSKDADIAEQQIEYAGFLSSPVLRKLPLATTIGNHDSKSINYSNHYNNPNTAATADTTEGRTVAGTDYYFTYGNTLFVVIDTNNYNCATHENVIKEATKANPDAKWKVLMFHQDIYGSGYDHSDSDGIVLRTQLTPIIDKYDFDAVLQGHDHTYSRTKQLTSDGKEHENYSTTPKQPATGAAGSDEFNAYLADNNCYNIVTGETDKNKVVDPKGTVYFEANSSTGSKFYQLIGTQQDYIAARSQSWRPTYSVIDVTDTTFTVKTYDAATNKELVADGGVPTSYTIVKEADKTSLTKALDEAKSKLSEAKASGTYTEESVAALEKVINEAQKIADNAESDTTAIASAVTSLNDAVKGLATAPAKDVTDPSKDTDKDTGSDADNGGATVNQDDSNANADASKAGTDDASKNADAKTVSAAKNSKNPKTGDTNSMASMLAWFALGGCSLAGLSYIVVSERKKKKTQEGQIEK